MVVNYPITTCKSNNMQSIVGIIINTVYLSVFEIQASYFSM